MPPQAKPKSIECCDKTFRVNSNGKQELVRASKLEIQPDGLTFKDEKGNVVGVFRGYGLSAVVDERATSQQPDPCETVKAMDFI